MIVKRQTTINVCVELNECTVYMCIGSTATVQQQQQKYKIRIKIHFMSNERQFYDSLTYQYREKYWFLFQFTCLLRLNGSSLLLCLAYAFRNVNEFEQRHQATRASRRQEQNQMRVRSYQIHKNQKLCSRKRIECYWIMSLTTNTDWNASDEWKE